MKIRRKRSFHEITTPKTDLPKSRPLFNPTTQDPAPQEQQQTSQEKAQEGAETSLSPLIQRSLVGSSGILSQASTLPPEGNIGRSPAPDSHPAPLYRTTVPRSDGLITPPRRSPILPTVQCSSLGKSPGITSQSSNKFSNKSSINWRTGNSPLQRKSDPSPISPLPTQWQPSHLVQRQALNNSTPTIQRDEKGKEKKKPPTKTAPPVPISGRPLPPLPDNLPGGKMPNGLPPITTDNIDNADNISQDPPLKSPSKLAPNPPSDGQEETEIPNKLKAEIEKIQKALADLDEARASFETQKAQQEQTAASKLQSIEQWLQNQAGKSQYQQLFYTYQNRSPLQRLIILNQLGVTSFSVDEAKQKLKPRKVTKFGRRQFDWVKFTSAMQLVQAVDPWNDTLTRDMSEITGIVASGGASALSVLASWGGGTRAFAVEDWAGEAAAFLGIITLGITAYREYTELLADNDLGQYKTRVGKLAVTFAEMGRYTSTGLVTLSGAAEHGTAHLEKLGNVISGTAAMAAAGAFAIASGTVNVGVGISQLMQGDQNQRNLEDIGEREDLNTDLTTAAQVGAQTQRWERDSGGAKIAKGTMMIVGGALLLAGIGPAGWALLAVAGIVGGAAALAKYLRWKKRKQDFVDRELGVNELYQQQTGRERGDSYDRNVGFFKKQKLKRSKANVLDQIRNRRLQEEGFATVDQYYYHRLNQMAGTVLATAQVEMKALQAKLPPESNTNKQRLMNYFQEHNLGPKEYPALCILIGLGLKMTVKRMANGRLPDHNHVVRQLDYGS